MSVRPSNWRAIGGRRADNPINRCPPTRFPYLEEIMRDPAVVAALDLAWRDTNADIVPVISAAEQGGWIYMNLRTGRLTIIRKENRLGPANRPGENQQGYLNINLNSPQLIAGSVVVAIFHTHPSVPFTGASDPDRALDTFHGVPGIIRGRDGQYDFTGPERRAGDFQSAARYPGFPP
jgi:hypothetical protein